MGFLDIVFGDQNNRGDHGFRAGFLPAVAPSLVAAGAVVLGAPAGAAVVAVTAAVAAAVAAAGAAGAADTDGGAAGASAGAAGAVAVLVKEKMGYNPNRSLPGAGAGLTLGAALVYSVVTAHLPSEQPKARVDGPTPPTLKIQPSGGILCEGFKIENSKTTNEQGRKVYTLFVPQGCSLAPTP